MKKQTVLANPGSIGLSIAGETDRHKIIANIKMMANRISNSTTSTASIGRSLVNWGLEPTQENIDRVKSFFPAGYQWRDEDEKADCTS